MNDKILFVDDEISILEGYQRLLHNEFQIDIAVGGRDAMLAFEATGPYAVVVSDMGMPEMDGAQLLARIKIISPETMRVMLTGYSDVRTAVTAVNEGSIFRFLTKPCDKDTLIKALTASLAQARMVAAEKDLLEKTLKGSIHVLAEVLSLVNPAAFGRGMRLRRYIQHISRGLSLSEPWRFEIAAMLSQLGCVTMAPETIEAIYSGHTLPRGQQARYDTHPQVAHDLLCTIPRMEPIAWMIAHQNKIPAPETTLGDRDMADKKLGAEILRIALQYDELLSRLGSKTEALRHLEKQQKNLDRRILQALQEVEYNAADSDTRSYDIAELTAGMILAEDIRTSTGLLLAPKGHEITVTLILKLKNLLQLNAIKGAASIVLTKPLAAGAASGAS